ncbi:hypothetical protein KC968_03015 [Candidatus Saccharibacteria bacterium]|nr:hypothetical protein [Candidatus Saccharibacteria bacterium]
MNFFAHNGVEHATNNPVSMAHATTPNYLLIVILLLIILAISIFIITRIKHKPQSSKLHPVEKSNDGDY